jgi:hypothetical protein
MVYHIIVAFARERQYEFKFSHTELAAGSPEEARRWFDKEFVRPAWAHSCGCKSRRKLITANEVKRNCVRATERGEEAWSETASRWTRTG